MPYLTLNGITVPIAVGSASRSLGYLGTTEDRAFSGQARSAARGRKSEWRFRTTPMPLAESVAFQGLIQGQGDAWSFDVNRNSGRGRVPVEIGSIGNPSGPGSLVNGGLYCSWNGGYAARSEWSVGAFADWTLLAIAYRTLAGANGWNRWVVRSDGAKWVQGVRGDTANLRLLSYNATTGVLTARANSQGGSAWAASQARTVGSLTEGFYSYGQFAFEAQNSGTTGASAPSWGTTPTNSTVLDGTVTWKNVGEAAGTLADVAFLPFKVPDAWVPQVLAEHLARQWTAPPLLRASGDFSHSSVLVRGEVLSATPVPFTSGGVWTLGESIEFSLKEV